MANCIYCKNPTQSRIKVGKYWRPVHKKCVRKEARRRVVPIPKKPYTAFVKVWVKQSLTYHGASAKEVKASLAKKLGVSPRLIKVERKR